MAVFYAVNLLLGVVLELSVFWLLYRLDVGLGTAAATAGLFAAAPHFVLWQSVLFYTFMLAALVALSGVCLVEFLRCRRVWAAAAFFAVLFLLCGVRALFHLGFFVLVAAALVVVCRSDWRKIVLCAALPGLLLVSIYAKNYFVFGQFGVSTWFGLNFWSMTTRNIPLEDRKTLVRQGVLSPISLLDRETKFEGIPARVPGCLEVSQRSRLGGTAEAERVSQHELRGLHCHLEGLRKRRSRRPEAAPTSFLVGLRAPIFVTSNPPPIT